jgi:hypothetical protein
MHMSAGCRMQPCMLTPQTETTCNAVGLGLICRNLSCVCLSAPTTKHNLPTCCLQRMHNNSSVRCQHTYKHKAFLLSSCQHNGHEQQRKACSQTALYMEGGVILRACRGYTITSVHQPLMPMPQTACSLQTRHPWVQQHRSSP